MLRTNPEQFASVRRVLHDALQARAFPGCAWGVLAIDQQLEHFESLGQFTFEADAPRVTAETVFDVASLTKVVATTAAAMWLVDRGKLDVGWLVGDLLPGFVVGREAGEMARYVKLRHLLAHNSGLPGYVRFFQTASTAADLYSACLKLPLEADPGARAEYSDPGFLLLGKALEVLLREDLATWTERHLYRPLGMNATGFRPAAGLRAQIPPTEMDATFRQRRIQGEVQDENAFVAGGVAGHAGLFSNVPDLLRFSRALLGDAGGAAPLFSPGTMQIFAERQSPEGSSRALGWDTPSQPSSAGQFFSRNSIGHLGFGGCSLWIDIEARVAAVLLTNRTWPDRSNEAIRQIRPSFHDAVRQAIAPH